MCSSKRIGVLLVSMYWILGVASLKLMMATAPIPTTTLSSNNQHKFWYDDLINKYDHMLDISPIGTKCATSAVGFFIGDAVAQFLTAKSEKVETLTTVHKPFGPLVDIISVQEIPKRFDFRRSLIMTSFGFLLHGPFCHHLFNFLETLLPGKEWEAVLQKVLLDQVVFCPLFSSVFLTYVNLLNGKKLTAMGAILKTDLPKMIFTSWKIWTFIHVVSYLFVPLRFRVLFVNAIQIFYSIFLSLIGNKSEPAVEVIAKSVSVSGESSTAQSSVSSDSYDEMRELRDKDDEQYM